MDLTNFKKLPDDIIIEVLKYIPKYILAFTNTIYYNKYHHLIKKHIKLYDSCVRDMIMRDNYYVFKRMVRENINNWIKIRLYKYQYKIFSNYNVFLLYFCIDNDSYKCKSILLEELSKRDLCINLHKRMLINI